MDATLAAQNKGNYKGFSIKISEVMSKSMLYLVDKTLNLKKVSDSIDTITLEIKEEIDEIDNLETADLRQFYLDMLEVKERLEPFKSVIGIAKSEAKMLRPNFVVLFESFEEFVHYSLLLVQKLESSLGERAIDEDADDYHDFLRDLDLVSITEKNPVTGSGPTVDDLFK